MNTEDALEQAGQTIEQGKALYKRTLKKARNGAKAADKILHRNAYNVLAVGVLTGFLTGYLVSRGCRCCAS
jgi:ElaB/YqjD/DUF883 family membrane-anchored ribosome-binding protein